MCVVGNLPAEAKQKKDAAHARGDKCKLNFLLSVDGNTFGSTHQQEAGPRTASICLY